MLGLLSIICETGDRLLGDLDLSRVYKRYDFKVHANSSDGFRPPYSGYECMGCAGFCGANLHAE